MEIRVLNYYLAVAREGSLTAASRILHITQPTLSRQLKALEDELGQKLFVRTNYNIKLTKEGRLFQERAQDIVDMANKTLSEFHTMEQDEISGDVYIGAGETEKLEYFAGIIKELQTKYPDVRYHFHTGNLSNITERLDNGLVDFGIVFQEYDAVRYNYRILPDQDLWGVIMRRDSPLALKDRITPDDLRYQPLILSRQASDKELSNWFGKKYRYLNIVSTYDLLYNASLLVKAGVGYAIGLKGIINTDAESLFCFRPLSPSLKTNIILLWRKHTIFSKAAEVFYNRIMIDFEK